MDTQRPDSGARSGEGKVGRGWRLTKVAWTLVRHDRTMLTLALIGVASATAFTALIFVLGGYFTHPGNRDNARLGLIALIAFYPSVLVSVFFNVALASAASAAFDGERLSVREAVRMAWGKRGRIAAWALISAVVGALISEIASRLPGGAKLVGWLAGSAWGLATIFVVPILAMEGVGAVDAIKRSAGIVKSRWGEGLTGNFAIGAWAVVVTIPACILLGIGAATARRQPGAGLAMVGVGVIALVAITTVVAATRQVFAVALYRYAIDAPIGGFSTADLENPFIGGRAKEKRKSWILRIGVPIIALFVLLVILAAIFGKKREGTEGVYSAYVAKTSSVDLPVGAPVVVGGRRIGTVLSVSGGAPQLAVEFRVDPGYGDLVESTPAYVVGSEGRQSLCVGSTYTECVRGSPPSISPADREGATASRS